MVVKKRSTRTAKYNLVVGRLGDLKKITANKGTTISESLEKCGLRPSKTEKIQDPKGNEYSGSEEVENKMCYYIVTKVKLGC